MKFFWIISVPLFAQISPGKLTRAHADLEGLSNCTKCHEIGNKVINSKCLDCHSEIELLVNAGSGYHSSADVKGKLCSKCHSEHHGRKFRIVNFKPKSFDHNKTGYKLSGAHAKAKCEDCHKSENILDPKIKKRSGTYLGLNDNCFSCHRDFHQKTLGDNCASCHNTEKFRPAAKFDHNKAKFKLTGEHLKVDCVKCHAKSKKNGKDFQKFTGLKFANCSACHKDVHKGKFGADCKSCHVTTAFSIINKKNFKHSKTNFPLIGKHKKVGCNKCHKQGIKQKPKFANCTDCHSDYHKGEFTVNQKVQDCKTCHTEYGFTKTTFTIENHNKLKFKLEGSHLAIPCQSCHLKEKKQWHFKKIGFNCVECHKNIHGTELSAEYLPKNDCTACHTTESWSTINFDHKRTKFELLGKHNQISCGNCHSKEGSNGKKEFIFKSLKENCEQCHNDIHFGQFVDGEFTDCTKCHTFNDWKPEKFDHEKTKFSLKGAHEKLKCSRCHKTVETKGVSFIKYKLEDFKCASCHS